MIFGTDKEGNRYRLWPIGVGVHGRANDLTWSYWGWHGWQIGYEDVPVEKTSFGCVPGKRSIFGQTLHLGRLFVTFGPRSTR